MSDTKGYSIDPASGDIVGPDGFRMTNLSVVAVLNRAAEQHEQLREEVNAKYWEGIREDNTKLRASVKSLAAQRDAAVEACRKFADGGDCYCHELAPESKPCGVCAALAVLSDTPTPAPSVNAELLKACRELLRVAESDPDTTGFVVRDESGKMTGTRMLSDIVRDAKAAIANAEKGGVG